MSETTQHFLAFAYIIVGIIVLFWVIRLASVLPQRYSTNNWQQVWVGFDIFLAIMLGATGLLVLRNSVWAIIVGSATATLLLVDVWFDVMTSKNKRDRHQAMWLGFLVEIPLAAATLFFIVSYLRNHL